MPKGRFSRSVQALVVLAATGTTAAALAAPPVDVGAAARGRSSVDRALESRARVLDRSQTSGRAAADAAAGASIDRGPSASAAAAGSSSAATERGPGAAATFGLDTAASKRNDSASPQLGTGRVARELRGTVNAAGRTGLERADRTGRQSRDTVGHTGLRLGWSKRGEVTADGDAAAVSAGVNGDVAVRHGRRRDPERILNRAEAHLAQRLAQIDRMRDRAIESGDEALLQQADKLEVLARAQFSQRTTGERTVGAAMKTFNADQRTARNEETAPVEETSPSEGGTEPSGETPAEPTTVTASAEADVTANDGGAVVQTGAAVEGEVSVE